MTKYRLVIITPTYSQQNLESLQQKLFRGKKATDFEIYNSAEEFYKTASKPENAEADYCILQIMSNDTVQDPKFYLNQEQIQKLNIASYLVTNDWSFLDDPGCLRQFGIRYKELSYGMRSNYPEGILTRTVDSGPSHHDEEAPGLQELENQEVNMLVFVDQLPNPQLGERIKSQAQALGINGNIQYLPNPLDIEWDEIEGRVLILNTLDLPIPANDAKVRDKTFYLLDVPSLTKFLAENDSLGYLEKIREAVVNYIQGKFDLVDQAAEIGIYIDSSWANKYNDEQNLNWKVWEKRKQAQPGFVPTQMQSSSPNATAQQAQQQEQQGQQGQYQAQQNQQQNYTQNQYQNQYQQQNQQQNSPQAQYQQNRAQGQYQGRQQEQYQGQQPQQQPQQRSQAGYNRAGNPGAENNIYSKGKSLGLLYVGIPQQFLNYKVCQDLNQFLADNGQVASFESLEQAYNFSKQYPQIVFNLVIAASTPNIEMIPQVLDFQVGMYIVTSSWDDFKTPQAGQIVNQAKQAAINGTERFFVRIR